MHVADHAAGSQPFGIPTRLSATLLSIAQSHAQGKCYGLCTDLRICPECANLDLARRDRAVRVDDDRQERVLVLLLHHLRAAVDAGQPAAVARVAVVPAHHDLQPPRRLQSTTVLNHIDAREAAHAGLRSFSINDLCKTHEGGFARPST